MGGVNPIPKILKHPKINFLRLWMVDDLFSAGLSTKTSSMTSCGKLVENNDTSMGLVDHAGPSPLFSQFIPSIYKQGIYQTRHRHLSSIAKCHVRFRFNDKINDEKYETLPEAQRTQGIDSIT